MCLRWDDDARTVCRAHASDSTSYPESYPHPSHTSSLLPPSRYFSTFSLRKFKGHQATSTKYEYQWTSRWGEHGWGVAGQVVGVSADPRNQKYIWVFYRYF